MSYLQIASWNIEHLGGYSRATRKQSAFALAEHIEMGGIDLIALQEIYVLPADQIVHLTPGGREVASLVLIGDTNIVSNTEPAIDLLIDAGFVDLNNHDAPTYGNYMGRSAPFDRAFVRQKRPKFRYSRQYILHSSDIRAHDRFLSDHYMIKVPIKDYVDDQDTRHEPGPTPPSA
ncbi:MAG TPA: hypothetical protein VMF13_23530 [Luteitalea sp.]|nr:hypothetical protein [Luteitalea sp.]